MMNYVAKAFAQFNHPMPTQPQYAPHKWNKPAYGQKYNIPNHLTLPRDFQRQANVAFNPLWASYFTTVELWIPWC